MAERSGKGARNASAKSRSPWKLRVLIVLACVVLAAIIAVLCWNLIHAEADKVYCWWGDSSAVGRKTYSTQSEASEELADQVVFNSVKKGDYGNELRFFTAQLDGTTKWEDHEVKVKDGQIYVLRVYADNNGGETATGTRVAIDLPTTTAKQILVRGIISAENATPRYYYDSLRFISEQPFHLEYIYGATQMETDELGLIDMDDRVVTKAGSENGVLIGYNRLNGEMPGGTDAALTIRVKVVMDEPGFTSETKVRLNGATSWQKAVDVKAGDLIEVQFSYENTSDETQQGVCVNVVLPRGMELVPGTTKLYNNKYPDGAILDQDTIHAGYINIGNYAAGANAYVRCTVQVTDTAAIRQTEIWARIFANDIVMQNYCTVKVGR